MALPKLLSPEQLSELFELPLATIYRWNYAKTGPQVLRIGRHVRYREKDVEAWLDKQALEQGSEENNLSRANSGRKPVGRPRLAE